MQLTVKSLKQSLINKHSFIFTGAVDLLIKDRVRILADKIFFDSSTSQASAVSTTGAPVIVQDNDVVVFTQTCRILCDSAVLEIEDARVSVEEGFFSAKKIERDAEGVWRAHDIACTPCDADDPHWHFCAARGMYGSSCLTFEQIRFALGKAPVAWLPGVVIPVAHKARSGFLLPRISYDYRYGPGLRQDYYWYLNPHADVTTGIDWKNNQGIFGVGDLRWATSVRHKGNLKGYFGYAENLYVQDHDLIVQAGKVRYALKGENAYSVKNIMGFHDAIALNRVDCGSDKKTGYEFFDRLEEVEDSFYNAVLTRGYNNNEAGQFFIDSLQISRKKFFTKNVRDFFSQEELTALPQAFRTVSAIQEFDTRSRVSHFPHVSLGRGVRTWGNFFCYHDAIMADYALMREEEVERIFLGDRRAREERTVPRASADALRFDYEGSFSSSCSSRLGTFYVRGGPHLNVRSKVLKDVKKQEFPVLGGSLFAHGGYRVFAEGEVGMKLPRIEGLHEARGLSYSGEIGGYAAAVPQLVLENWYGFDFHDRWYPRKELGIQCEQQLKVFTHGSIDLKLRQGYDFARQSAWFSGERVGTPVSAWKPLQCAIEFTKKGFQTALVQEWDRANARVCKNFLQLGMVTTQGRFRMGYLYQDTQLAGIRGLFEDAAHTVYLDIVLHLTKKICLYYEGFFVSEKASNEPLASFFTPLRHEVRLEYRGHCWGGYVGIEEKFYRQYGNGRREHALVLSISFDSLGSFAKKIKSSFDEVSAA